MPKVSVPAFKVFRPVNQFIYQMQIRERVNDFLKYWLLVAWQCFSKWIACKQTTEPTIAILHNVSAWNRLSADHRVYNHYNFTTSPQHWNMAAIFCTLIFEPRRLADVVFPRAETWPLQSISEHLKSKFSSGYMPCVTPVSSRATTVPNSIEKTGLLPKITRPWPRDKGNRELT